MINLKSALTVSIDSKILEEVKAQPVNVSALVEDSLRAWIEDKKRPSLSLSELERKQVELKANLVLVQNELDSKNEAEKLLSEKTEAVSGSWGMSRVMRTKFWEDLSEQARALFLKELADSGKDPFALLREWEKKGHLA